MMLFLGKVVIGTECQNSVDTWDHGDAVFFRMLLYFEVFFNLKIKLCVTLGNSAMETETAFNIDFAQC